VFGVDLPSPGTVIPQAGSTVVVLVDRSGVVESVTATTKRRRESSGAGYRRAMTTNEPEPKRSEDHEFPFMELFNAEDAIEHPGEPVEDLDLTDDSDAPAP